MKIRRAAKYGFCAGVRIADKKVKKFAAEGNRGAILGQVVHNERVVQEMERLGVATVDRLDAQRLHLLDHALVVHDLAEDVAGIAGRGKLLDLLVGDAHSGAEAVLGGAPGLHAPILQPGFRLYG